MDDGSFNLLTFLNYTQIAQKTQAQETPNVS